MLEINNTRVYGLEESIISSGYPMMAEEISEWDDYAEDLITEKDINRAIKLGNTPQGSGHSNYLKGIIVQFDLKYPNYFTPQLQRYNFIDIVSSTSKMHKLIKMDIDEMCNKYVDEEVIMILRHWIEIYNGFPKDIDKVVVADGWMCQCEQWQDFSAFAYNGMFDEKYGEGVWMDNKKEYTKHEIFMKIISNTPMGLEQTMRISTNYLQLRTIYNQRKSHKLEDWSIFCDWCETLPYFKEFCLGGING
jgi:hypothetical protein